MLSPRAQPQRVGADSGRSTGAPFAHVNRTLGIPALSPERTRPRTPETAIALGWIADTGRPPLSVIDVGGSGPRCFNKPS